MDPRFLAIGQFDYYNDNIMTVMIHYGQMQKKRDTAEIENDKRAGIG